MTGALGEPDAVAEVGLDPHPLRTKTVPKAPRAATNFTVSKPRLMVDALLRMQPHKPAERYGRHELGEHARRTHDGTVPATALCRHGDDRSLWKHLRRSITRTIAPNALGTKWHAGVREAYLLRSPAGCQRRPIVARGFLGLRASSIAFLAGTSPADYRGDLRSHFLQRCAKTDKGVRSDSVSVGEHAN